MRAKRTARQKSERPSTTPSIAPRLLRRPVASAYLSVSPAMFDELRRRGEIAPVPMPAARREGPIRTPLFDRADLDLMIERWKSNGGAQ